MPSSTSPTVVPLSTRVKMEDRKRPAVNGTDDIAPPSKRQAINGSGKSKEDNDAKDEAWVEVSFLFITALQHHHGRTISTLAPPPRLLSVRVTSTVGFICSDAFHFLCLSPYPYLSPFAI